MGKTKDQNPDSVDNLSQNGIGGESQGKTEKGVVREYTEAIFIALVIALFLRAFVVEAFKIPSASMVPTLLVGDHLFVNKFIYGLRIPFTNKKILSLRSPKRGEIIVFIYPHDRSKDYIKRVVGTPGDKIEVRNNRLFINEEEMVRNFEDDYLYADINQKCVPSKFFRFRETLGENSFAMLHEPGHMPNNYGPQWIEEGHLFVMGDNRDNSSDSRVWGTVPMENVKGKAMFIWLSYDQCGFKRTGFIGKATDWLTFSWLRPKRFFNWLH
jgi:signal peptidase I